MSKKIITLDIMSEGYKIATAYLDSIYWQDINYLDYIEIDRNGAILPEFETVHGTKVYKLLTDILNHYTLN